MPDGSLFGLIHDLKDRTRQRQVRDAQRNYLTDPQAAITAVNEIDPGTAIQMKALHEKELEDDQKKQLDQQTRYKTALTGMAQGLYKIQQGGGDVGTAFDDLSPVLTNAFGMKPEEIQQWKQQATANPGFLKELNTYLLAPDDQKMAILAPGSVGADPITGEIRVRNPGQAHVVKMRDGNGGEHTFMIDENGNLIGGNEAVGPSALGTAGAAASYAGPRTIDPKSRGMQNGNPGNIKDSPWARKQPGYIGSDGVFAKFAPGYGESNQEKLLETNYVNGQRTVPQIVDKYLGFPASKENSPEQRNNYVAYVAGRLGLDPSKPVPPSMVRPLAQAMREFESGGSGGGPRAIAETPGKTPEDKGWRPLTDEEKKQYPNLRQDVDYQIGIGGANDGMIKPVGGEVVGKGKAAGPNGGKPGTLTMQAHHAAVDNLSKVRDQARELLRDPNFDQATGSIQGRMPSIMQGSVDFDNKLHSFVGRTVVDALITMKQNSPNGATGFGQMNKTEGDWLRDSKGAFRQSSPEDLKQSLKSSERDAMVSIGMTYNIPPEATAFLLAHPDTAAQYDAKFGKGMAHRVRGY